MWKMLKAFSQLLEVELTHKALKGWMSAGWWSECGREKESVKDLCCRHHDSNSLRGQS